MKIIKFAYLFLFLSFTLTTSGQETDTLSTVTMDEVLVKSKNHTAIKDGVSYIPTPEERRQSSNIYSLLGRMMVAGLHVDEFTNKVETAWGKEVHFFINGMEAQEWETKALRPKEVARVEFLQSPSEPRYKGYQSVVNFVLREYTYGGYVQIEGQQGFVNDFGDYGLTDKLRKGRYTWQAMTEVYYVNTDDIESRQNTTFLYNDLSTLDKSFYTETDEHQRVYVAGSSLRYDSDKLTWIVQGGVRYAQSPEGNVKGLLSLSSTPSVSNTETVSYAQTMVPYGSFVFQLTRLPHEAYAYGGVSFSYNHNNASSMYKVLGNEGVSLANGHREDAYLPSVWIAYARPVVKNNYLTLSATFTSELYRTQYLGTEDTYQRLNNTYYNISAQYSHMFSNSWSGTFLAYMPIQQYKVNDQKSVGKVYVNGSLSLNGRIGKQHSIYVQAQITQSQITPSYYNTVVRQDNETEGSKGNNDLKTVRQAYAIASYTWMPSNTFSLNTSFSWDNIINDIVPYWHEENGLMVSEMINSGSFNPIYVSLSPSLSLLKGKLRLSSKFLYTHEWHSGLFQVNCGYFGIYPSAYWNINGHWSANLYYGYTSGKGYMRGGSEQSKFADNLKLGLQYTTGNLFVKLQVNSVFRKNGWVKSWLDSNNIHRYEYLSRPSDGRYATLTVSYTIDYGKKMQHGNNYQFEGKRKSSVL